MLCNNHEAQYNIRQKSEKNIHSANKSWETHVDTILLISPRARHFLRDILDSLGLFLFFPPCGRWLISPPCMLAALYLNSLQFGGEGMDGGGQRLDKSQDENNPLAFLWRWERRLHEHAWDGSRILTSIVFCQEQTEDFLMLCMICIVPCWNF